MCLHTMCLQNTWPQVWIFYRFQTFSHWTEGCMEGVAHTFPRVHCSVSMQFTITAWSVHTHGNPLIARNLDVFGISATTKNPKKQYKTIQNTLVIFSIQNSSFQIHSYMYKYSIVLVSSTCIQCNGKCSNAKFSEIKRR